MKISIIRIHLYAFLLLTAFACSEDEFMEITVGPPSDIQLSFSIAGDDSGELTVFPGATNASYFDIYYGDVSGETPERVPVGEVGKHTYAEGQYAMRAVAYSLSGETAEITQPVNIQFTPPENLQVEVTIDPVNTNVITVTPTADNAALFEIYFGDVEEEEPTNIMAGESIQHTYAETGTYTLRVVARSASSTTLEYTEELNIVKPLVQLTLPIDFENPEISYAFVSFGGAELSLVDNPDPSGANTSVKVGRLFKTAGAEVWAGGLLQLPNAIDFNAGDQFSVKVWSPKSGITVRLKVENESDPNIFYELDATTTVADQWETLSYDFSGIDKSQAYHKVVIFMDFGNRGDGTEYFFDDFVLSGGIQSFSLPINFEADNVDYTFVDFGNVTTSRIDNPDPSGLNTSAKVAALNKPGNAETWGGAFMQLGGPIDFTANDQLTAKVWSPKSGIIVKMKVENSADPNINYEVDVTNTVSNGWEQLVYDFSGIDKSQEYDRVVIFFDFGANGDGSDYYFDDIQLVTGDSGPVEDILALPLNFESETLSYNFNAFGNVTAGVIANPDPSGINTSANVARQTKPAGAETWGGAFIQLPDPIDFSTMTTMEFKAWSPKSGINVLLKLENATDGNTFHEVQVVNTKANEWELLTFDMSAIDKTKTYHKVVIFFDFGVNGDGSEYFFDDIELK
jgi:hypothetical protein